jgi:hypothetical protein
MRESDCNNMAPSIHGIVRPCDRNAIDLAGGAIDLAQWTTRSEGAGIRIAPSRRAPRKRAYAYEVIFGK